MNNLFLWVIASLFGGGSLVWVLTKSKVKEIALEALKEIIAELKKEDEKLHQRINKNEDSYVSCTFCNMQHANLKTTLDSMDNKLDILIDKSGKSN